MNFNHIIDAVCGEAVYWRIAAILLKSSEGVSGRGLAALLKVSTFKVHHSLKFLVAQGILKSSVVGRSHLYRLNHDHVLVRKVILPLLHFQENIYWELGKEILARLKPRPLSIILYGSVARGEEKPDSDLDLFLVYRDKDKQKVGRISENELWMENITRKYGNFVSVRRGTVGQLQWGYKEKDELMCNIVKEGRVIAGLSITDLLIYGR